MKRCRLKANSTTSPSSLWTPVIPPEHMGGRGYLSMEATSIHKEPVVPVCDPVELLCGRCLTCKRETRTFNGLCFRCLQWHTDPPLGERDRGPQCCRSVGCVYYGSVQHSGYCSRCSRTQGESLTRISHSGALRKAGETQSSSSLQLSSTLRELPRCCTPHCGMLGNPAFQWLCERCHISRCHSHST